MKIKRVEGDYIEDFRHHGGGFEPHMFPRWLAPLENAGARRGRTEDGGHPLDIFSLRLQSISNLRPKTFVSLFFFSLPCLGGSSQR